MNDEPQDLADLKAAPRKKRLWPVWIFLGLAPIPIGLLMGPEKIFNSLQNNHQGLLDFYLLITVVCSMLCGLGQSNGLINRKVSAILGGLFAGMVIAVFNVSVVLFAGCCSAFSRI